MKHTERRRLFAACCAAAAFAVQGGLAAEASATQYDLIDNFDTSPIGGGEAYGVDRGHVVGISPYTLVTDGAVIWTSPSQRINLNPGPGVVAAYPAGYQTSTAFAIYGNQEVGQGIAQDHNRHAMLWTGSAASAVDLSITSSGTIIGWATATDGAQQVGVVSGSIGGDAALWSGTPDSFVNLNPSGYDASYAQGVYGGLQVGYGQQHGAGINALLWNGSASSYTVLAVAAEAMGISRGQVVGLTGESRPGSYRDAVIWTNATAASFTDVAPVNTTASELLSTNGTQQVGDYSIGSSVLGQLPVDHHAAVWTGTSASFQPLAVPNGDNWSMAYSIDGDGNIAGTAGIENNGGVGSEIPVMWVPHRLPGDANFDGIVNFSDLLILAQHYGQPGEWVDGEFSGGGTVNFADLLTLAQHYGQSQPALQYSLVLSPDGQPGQVPEPTSLLTVICALGLIYRGSKLRRI